MKDEIKEIKIGMYTTDEILEFMTDGEGRGFMGRSMYDAILDCITNLQEEIQKKEAMYDSLAVSYRLEQEENERLNNIINKTTKLLKQAGSYDEETKQFCDDVWEELPDILSVLEESDK